METENSDENQDGDQDDLEAVEGLRAWAVVLGSFLMHFVVIGYLYSFSVFVAPYEEEFAVSRAEVSLVYTLTTGMMFLGGLPAGRLSDTYGARIVMAVGTVFWCLGYLLTSFATEFWQVVLCQGFMVGIGNAGLYWPGVTVVAQWFDQRRAFALGVSVVGAGVGNFTFGILVNTLVIDLGFRTALQITAGIGLGLLSLATVCIKRRLPKTSGGGILGNKEIFSDGLFPFILLTAFFFQFGYHGPFVFLAAFARDNGIDPSVAAICVGLLGIGSAVGRIGLGILADCFGRVRCFQASLFLTGVALALWPLCIEPISLGTFAFVFGFASGGFIALVPVVVAEYYGTARLGSTMGLVSLALIPGSAGGPPIIGVVYDETGDYLIGTIFSACAVFVAVAFMLPLPKNGEVYRKNQAARNEKQAANNGAIVSEEDGLESQM